MVNLQMLQILTTNTHMRVCVHVTGGYIVADRDTFVSRLKSGFYQFPIAFDVVMGDTLYID